MFQNLRKFRASLQEVRFLNVEVLIFYREKIMAATRARAALQIPCKLSVVSSLLSRNGGWNAHLQCTRRAVGTLRSKAEEMKDGYNTKRDSHLDGKTPEEVIKELLSHKQIDPTDRKNTRSAKSKQYVFIDALICAISFCIFILILF